MCGICGFTGFKNDELLRRMTDVLEHRGPDAEGYYITDTVNLGVRRLAIIDLKTGDQPIYNEDKSIVVVFNGEIYNFLDLRRNLESKGHKFYTKTDTEVIVHLYEEYKEDTPKYLRGMFAFALWDNKNKKLLLARDHIGIKPLYYTQINGNLFFSSELKSILAYEKIPRQINFSALDVYLTFLYIPAPLTIFESIYKLLPGHFLVWEDNRIRTEKFWDLEIKIQDTKYKIQDEKEYIEELKGLLKKVVKNHLISDVPLGVFLSGGLDTSTIVAFASEFSTQPIKTFTIGYEEKDASYNEFDKAGLIAKRFGCEQREYTVKPDIVGILPEIIRHFDEPFADSSMIPTYLISKLARQNVTVALTGIGGDEIFGGYPRYIGAKASLIYEYLPLFLRRSAVSIAKFIPEVESSANWPGRIKRFLQGGMLPFSERYRLWVSFLITELKDKLYTPEFKFQIHSRTKFGAKTEIGSYFDLLNEKSLEEIFYVDLKTYLPGDLLCMADRMSMASSLELRVPLCDLSLVEFSAELPVSLKMKGFTPKYLLKKTMSEILPKGALKQKKMGFMIPLTRWTREEINPLIKEYLSESAIKKRGYFKPGVVQWMIKQHLENKKNFSDQLFAILILEIWHRSYLDKVAPSINIKREKLNILVVTDIIPFGEEGGSGKVAWEFSKDMALRGHTVVILTKGKKVLSEEEEIDKIKIVRFYSNLFKYREIFKKLNEKHHFDIICFNHPFSALGIIPLIGKIKIPSVYLFHSPWPEEYTIRKSDLKRGYIQDEIGKWLRKKIEEKVVSSSQKVVTLSKFMKERLKYWHNVSDEKISIIPGGIDLKHFSPSNDRDKLREELKIPKDKFLILTVRNLVSRMGLENLILAIEKLTMTYPNVYLVIVGKGYLEEKLKGMVRELKLDKFIHFTGYVSDEILPKYYQTADLFVLPTIALEGFGLVTLEAIACGTPVLATPVGGTVEILEKFDRDFLFLGTEPGYIADGIKKFIEHRDKYPDLEKKCRKFIEENYSWEKFTDQLENIFYEMHKTKFQNS